MILFLQTFGTLNCSRFGKIEKKLAGCIKKDVSIRIENDFLAFKDKDRWRSNAIEIGVGDFVIGTRLYNNDPKGEEKGDHILSLSGKPNTKGYGKWRDGKI